MAVGWRALKALPCFAEVKTNIMNKLTTDELLLIHEDQRQYLS
jgi:hypothetical protein